MPCKVTNHDGCESLIAAWSNRAWYLEQVRHVSLRHGFGYLRPVGKWTNHRPSWPTQDLGAGDGDDR